MVMPSRVSQTYLFSQRHINFKNNSTEESRRMDQISVIKNRSICVPDCSACY